MDGKNGQQFENRRHKDRIFPQPREHSEQANWRYDVKLEDQIDGYQNKTNTHKFYRLK